MLRSSGFQAIIDKQTILAKPVSKDSDETVTKTVLKLKVQISGSSQVFMDSFQKETNISNLSDLFTEDVVWSKISFPFKNYDRVDFDIDIEGDVEFTAKLIQVDVARKTKNGIDVFTYILTLEKDEYSPIDTIISNQYVRKYTRDGNDKRVLAQFIVTMKPTPVVVSTSGTNNMLGEEG